MSLVLSDTSTYKGIIQGIERELEFDRGYISDNTDRMKEWTADINLTHDYILARIFQIGGNWQFDDSNHTKHPIITMDVLSGQRDYNFTKDQQGNLVLDYYRVLIADANGIFHDLEMVDQQTPDNYNSDTSGFVDGQDLTGTPTKCDKTGHGIFLDLIPNYNSTGGLKVYISREGSYFSYDTPATVPGIDGRLHEAYVVHPSLKYALSRRPDLAQGLVIRNRTLLGDVGVKGLIDEIYGKRERTGPRRVVPLIENTR